MYLFGRNMHRMQNMARATIIATLGFDEKFLVRCVLRVNSTARASKLVLYVARPLDDYSRQRVERAWRELNRILGEYVGVSIIRRDVDPTDFWGIVELARRDIVEALREGMVVVCAGSGMRAVVVALVTAALTLPHDLDYSMIEIQADLESGGVYVSYTVAEALETRSLEAREYVILETIKRLREASVKDIHKETGIPKSTVSRLAKKLERLGYLEKVGHGIYRLRKSLQTTQNNRN